MGYHRWKIGGKWAENRRNFAQNRRFVLPGSMKIKIFSCQYNHIWKASNADNHIWKQSVFLKLSKNVCWTESLPQYPHLLYQGLVFCSSFSDIIQKLFRKVMQFISTWQARVLGIPRNPTIAMSFRAVHRLHTGDCIVDYAQGSQVLATEKCQTLFKKGNFLKFYYINFYRL